ncbi:MAG: TolC family protein [Synechococcales cyanobacterium]
MLGSRTGWLLASLLCFGGGLSGAAAWAQDVPTLPDSTQVVTPAVPPQFQIPADGVALPEDRDPLTAPTTPLEVRIESTQGLSLAEAMDLATAQNPQVRQAELGITSAQAGLDQALAAYAITAATDANYSYSQSALTSGDSSLLTITLIQLGYLLWDGGGRDARLEAAQETVRVAELTLQQTLQDVRLQAANAYYSLQSADAEVAVSAAAVANAEASLRDAQAQERAGISTRFEVLQAETALANNRQRLLRAENDQRLARRRLAEILNYASPTDVIATDAILPGAAWTLSLEESIVQAYQARPELEIVQRQVRRAEAQAVAALSATAPQLRLGASASTGDNLQTSESWKLGYSLTANLSIDWGDGGAAEASARQSRTEAAIAASRFDQNLASIRQEVEDAFLSLSSAREQIESARAAVTSATESLRLARLRFQAGVGTQTEVITAESALTEAQGNFSSAIIAYNSSLARLQRSIATL